MPNDKSIEAFNAGSYAEKLRDKIKSAVRRVRRVHAHLGRSPMTGGILSDGEIRRAVACGDIEIDPFVPEHVNPVSVDLTLGDEVLVYRRWVTPYMTNVGIGPEERLGGPFRQPYDYLSVKEEPETIRLKMHEQRGYTLRPGIGYLMHTRERIFTRKYVPVLDGKSSLGRLFLSVHETAGFGDPGFNGQYTLEVTVVHPLRVYPGMRIAQMRFHTICGEVEKQYAGNYVGEAARGPVASKAYRQFK